MAKVLIVILGLGLLAGLAGLAGCASSRAGSRASVVSVLDARTPAPASPDVGVVYFTVRNSGEAEQLVSVSTDVAGSAEVHTEIRKGSLITMAPVGPVAIPAHGRVSLSAGGTHLMLIGLTRTLKEGDHFGMTLHFRRFGDVAVSVPVVAYASP